MAERRKWNVLTVIIMSFGRSWVGTCMISDFQRPDIFKMIYQSLYEKTFSIRIFYFFSILSKIKSLFHVLLITGSASFAVTDYLFVFV